MRRLAIAGAFLGSCLLLGSKGGCDGSENAFIMSQMHLVATEMATGPAGRTCADVSAGSGSASSGDSSGGGTNDFWMREESSSAGLSVQVGSFDEVLEDRFYDRAFIAAHAVERFVVTTQGGDQYAFVYWGGDSCETCPPSPFESLPGDPWGCGSQP